MFSYTDRERHEEEEYLKLMNDYRAPPPDMNDLLKNTAFTKRQLQVTSRILKLSL